MIYNDEKRFGELLTQFPYLTGNSNEDINPNEESKILKRIILQALRELMLTQSSDWQFLIYTNASKDYAEQRFFFHHSDFNRLCDLALKFAAEHNLTNDEWLYITEIEERDNIFPELKLENWKQLEW
jgi:1,4-alpha-glucan branching enzyme